MARIFAKISGLMLSAFLTVGACHPAPDGLCLPESETSEASEVRALLDLAFDDPAIPFYLFDIQFLRSHYEGLRPSPLAHISNSQPTYRRVAMGTVYFGNRREQGRREVGALANTNTYRPLFERGFGKSIEFGQDIEASDTSGENWGAVFTFLHLNQGQNPEAEFERFVAAQPDIFQGRIIRKQRTETCILGTVVADGRVVAAAAAFAPQSNGPDERQRWDYAACREAYYGAVLGLRNFPLRSVEWPNPRLKFYLPIPIKEALWKDAAARNALLSSDGQSYDQICGKLTSLIDGTSTTRTK